MTKRIQGYTLLQCVGKGSSAEVFRATHQSKQGQFAIKVIQNKLLIENPKAEECLLNEVKVLSKIGVCEFIVGFHELIKTKNHHYYVYDYCNGGNLYQKLKKLRRIPENEVLKYLKAILRAYKTLNKYKVLHRDLKPENILFHNGKLKLADFGLCKGLQPEEYMTKTMLGSPIYMAPEILKGQSYTSKADIWSLGVITFQMLYGYCPYHSNSIAALSSKIQTSSLQLPEQPFVNSSTKQLLKKMLTKDYFRRIGWIQLFKQLLNYEQGDLKSIKSFYDVEEMELKHQQSIIRNKSKSKSRIGSKKTSLCLIQCSSPVPNPTTIYANHFQANNNSINNILSPKNQLQCQNQSQQKENRIGFSSFKYMAILNRSQELKRQPNKKSPKFFSEENNYEPTYSNDSSPVSMSSYYSPPIYYKDYPTLQKNNSAVSSNLYTNVPNTKITKSPSDNIYMSYENNKNRAYYEPPKISSLTNKQTNIINLLKKGQLRISSNTQKEKDKKLKQYMHKLQKIHKQFVQIAPYCENLLKTKNEQHINDIMQLLHLLRSKMTYFREQFLKIKKNMNQEQEDIETMISYQIIGIEQVIQKINMFNTNESGMGKKLSPFPQNYSQYAYKSLSLEKASKKINQIFI